MHSAVLYDTEYTAWEGSMAARWLRPGEFREIVQIGAVKVDTVTLETRDELNIFVRPRINAVLSPYFESLTGITNDILAAQGVDFREAYDRFIAFAAGGPVVSFGRDDLVLKTNLRLYGMGDARPFPEHRNIAPWLVHNGVDLHGLHACDIAKACGAVFKGREHDALDDSRSLLEGLRALVKRGAPNFLESA